MPDIAFAHINPGSGLNRHHHLTIKVVLKAFIDMTPSPLAFLLAMTLSQDTQFILDLPFKPPQKKLRLSFLIYRLYQ